MAFNPELGTRLPLCCSIMPSAWINWSMGLRPPFPTGPGNPGLLAPDRDDDAYTVTDAQRGS
ncbi:hypothetical protein NUKP16_40490 [Klebsiella quasipneumoniae]|nr:hypothetical protein NUKP16_40490 [Klebsiella quasipneumoniae]